MSGSSILILETFKKQESVFEQGAQRVVTILTIDEIRDKVGEYRAEGAFSLSSIGINNF